jgi:hypothetical protein
MVRNYCPSMARAVALAIMLWAWIGCTEDALPTPNGLIQITVTSTGEELDANGYTILIDGRSQAWTSANGRTTLAGLAAGQHELELTDLSANCDVEGPNPRQVTVVAGTAETAFHVTCTALAPIGTLTMVSGSSQSGTVGTALPEPFVVRVATDQGIGLEDVEVAWHSDSGGGAFRGIGADEIPASAVVTRTDAEGLTHVSFTPTSFGVVTAYASIPAYCDYCPNWSQVTFRVDTRDPGASLTVMAGNDQQSKAGQPSEPLVVRVRDGEGNPVPLAAVQWEITDGQGALGNEGDEGGWARSWTDADGLASMPVIPLWFGPVGVGAEVTGVQGSPARFTLDASDPGAGLTMVSGNGQIGRTGEPLEEPFVVRVTDGEGNPVDRVRVEWNVVDGAGTIRGSSEPSGDGLHAASFSPSAAGSLRVSASPAGLSAGVSFTTDVTVLVITVYEWFGSQFSSPGNFYCDAWFGECPADDTIPLGTSVAWVVTAPTARIVSTSVPPGGSPFDSGTLTGQQRFQFTPEVTGTWEYTDSIGGARGLLRVY